MESSLRSHGGHGPSFAVGRLRRRTVTPAAAAIAGHQLGYGPCWPGPKKKALMISLIIHLEPVTVILS